jgi:hypothetical protein
MGMVIAWPGRRAGAASRRIADDEPRGLILFFTGVRYGRPDETERPAADLTTKRRGAPRSPRKRA